MTTISRAAVGAILMSGAMVRAVLDGKKSQTRRVLKPQPFPVGGPFYQPYPTTSPSEWHSVSRDGYIANIQTVSYEPRHLLWVKEGWADEHPLAVQSGRYSQEGRAGIPGPPPVKYRTIYRVDGEPQQIWRRHDSEWPYFHAHGPAEPFDARFPTVCSNYTKDGKGIYWESAGHMPRWASRITLEVTAVKVGRLQDISEEDAKAEGVEPSTAGHGPHGPIKTHRTGFVRLWGEINGPESWLANPWIVAVTFIPHRQNIDQFIAARSADPIIEERDLR